MAPAPEAMITAGLPLFTDTFVFLGLGDECAGRCGARLDPVPDCVGHGQGCEHDDARSLCPACKAVRFCSTQCHLARRAAHAGYCGAIRTLALRLAAPPADSRDEARVRADFDVWVRVQRERILQAALVNLGAAQPQAHPRSAPAGPCGVTAQTHAIRMEMELSTGSAEDRICGIRTFHSAPRGQGGVALRARESYDCDEEAHARHVRAAWDAADAVETACGVRVALVDVVVRLDGGLRKGEGALRGRVFRPIVAVVLPGVQSGVDGGWGTACERMGDDEPARP